MENIKLVSSAQVTGVLTYEELIPKIELSFKNVSSSSVSGVCQPLRTAIRIPKQDGFFGVMPVYCPDEGILSTKLLTAFPHNKDQPTHNTIIILFDAITGMPTTLMDGDTITLMRTAAASAVATKYLAPDDTNILAVIGAGLQAKSHIDALKFLFSFQSIRIWNRNKERADLLASEVGATSVSTVEDAVKDADVIVTVTSARTPILQREWIKVGAHINAVGACCPDWRELTSDLVNSSVLYVDSYAGGYKESGDIILAKAEIYAEIGEMLLGTKDARKKETTIFKSLGLGIQDAVSAKIVLDKLTV